MHTPTELSTVLDKLASDDAFREQLLGDPVTALAGLGINIDPAHVPAARSLPSKDLIAGDQAAIQSKLESSSGMILFLLSGQA
ncbi:NHLP-related RiPP peptide [Duganella callida]|uniref:Putative modified peptide n=1 Tax=Duganella callida TaxID=2561932 RepID=A0A4Y9SXI2_9BURK|nr:NHLP-related RiPP peptide [Duganella callida]TFW31425.1 putative modified peptide [Duganella callida]